jgi:hypothetical protein
MLVEIGIKAVSVIDVVVGVGAFGFLCFVDL